MPIRFRIRWVPLCATLVVAAAGIALGQWQTRRAEEKLATQHRIEARAKEAPLQALPPEGEADVAEFRHVLLEGEFIPQWTVYLENRPHEGAVGFHVLTAFKIAGSQRAVMVARGWAPRDATDRARVPQPPLAQGATRIDGVLRRDAGHVLQLGQADAPKPGAILQNLDVAALAAASGLPLSAYVVEQRMPSPGIDDGLARDWPAPSLGIDRHRAYALQWYALAAMAIVFFLVTGFRRGRNDKS
ncbi:SURF1 family protein [Herbaspirillum robiniae]|uniref:SURF1-like protein n=1 Tax=Herbaspirillum robiniae TaxID=2014887 RepID=A0ABX2LVY6_9BURK|nr:SURF1 family protein [Herbaspirillum robiniae]NUU02644.1 SURF1 family protein [Herbaspirillum robiniae]